MAEPATSASVFEALGDPQRRQILQLLGEAESSVQGLAEHLPISRPAVSRHLRVLKSAGLVSEAPRGAQRIYRLRAEGIDAIRDYLQGVWGDAAVRFRFFAENTETHRTSRDRATPPELRRRVLTGARLRHLDGQDRPVVAGGPHDIGAGRRRGGARARRRWADLRAHRRRNRARLGRGDGLGPAAPARLPVAPATKSRRRHRRRDPLRPAGLRRPASTSSTPVGSDWASTARTGGTATATAGKPCCPTSGQPSLRR